MNILIAVPTFESIMPDTYKAIIELDKGNNAWVFDFIRGYDCAAARNSIVKRGLNLQVDYILMVDNDTVLPQNALLNMLEDPKQVCLGYYPRRHANGLYDGKLSIYRPGEFDYVQVYHSADMKNMRDQGLFKMKIHGGGMGCALIRTDVFKTLKYPWFKWVNYDNGTTLSEDLYFCEQCNKSNIPIYTDTRVGCGHLFRRIQWPV